MAVVETHVDIKGMKGLEDYQLPQTTKDLILGYLNRKGLNRECSYAKDSYTSAEEAMNKGITDEVMIAGMSLLDAELKSILSTTFLLPSLTRAAYREMPSDLKRKAKEIAIYLARFKKGRLTRAFSLIKPPKDAIKIEEKLVRTLYEWHPDLTRLENDIKQGKI